MRKRITKRDNGEGNRNNTRDTNRKKDARGWPDKTAAHAHSKLGGEDRGHGLPEPLRDDIVRGLLHGKLEVRTRCVGGILRGRELVDYCGVVVGIEGFGRRRGDGEAAWLINAGDVDIEPLAGKELFTHHHGYSESLNTTNWKQGACFGVWRNQK